MKNNGIDGKLLPFVANQLGDDMTGHGLQHALRVFGNARTLQAREGGNLRIITAAALLHDCADRKLFDDTDRQRALIAGFLRSIDFSEEETDTVDGIIRTISFNQGENLPLSTIEAKIVRDADRLDAIGAVGIIRTIEYGTARHRPFYNPENPGDTGTTLNHFYEKLLRLKDLMHTPTARAMAEERHRFLERFLKQFYDETGADRP